MDDRAEHHRQMIQRMVIDSLWQRAGEKVSARQATTDRVGIAGPIAERGHRALSTLDEDTQ